MLIVSIIVYGIILVIELVKFNNALKKGKQREPYITTTVIAFGYIDKIIAGLIIGCTVLFVDYLGDKKHIDEI